MTKNFTLPTIPASGATKNDEYKFIDFMTANMPENTYLHSFFTDNLRTWITAAIYNDTCPDIYTALVMTQNDLYNALNERSKERQRAENNALDTQRAEARYQNAMNQLRETSNELRDAYARKEEEAHQLSNQLWTAKEYTCRLEIEVMQLKAKLYDMTNATQPAQVSTPAPMLFIDAQ